MNAYARWPPTDRRPRRQLPRPQGEATDAGSLAVRLRAARVAAFLGGEGGEPQTELDALISKTARLFSESITAETRKDYARRWRKFEAWCQGNGFEPLDCPSEVVMMFLADHIGGDRGAALGTLRSYMAAINRIHVEAGLMPPGDDPAMTMYLRTLRKVVVPQDPKRQISALRIGPLREVCRYLDSIGPDPVEVRDRALFALHRAGVGDGEIARLRWTDVRLTKTRATLVLRSVRADRSDRTVRIEAHKDPNLCGSRSAPDVARPGRDDRALGHHANPPLWWPRRPAVDATRCVPDPEGAPRFPRQARAQGDSRGGYGPARIVSSRGPQRQGDPPGRVLWGVPAP